LRDTDRLVAIAVYVSHLETRNNMVMLRHALMAARDVIKVQNEGGRQAERCSVCAAKQDQYL
jgi:hypothetical protein